MTPPFSIPDIIRRGFESVGEQIARLADPETHGLSIYILFLYILKKLLIVLSTAMNPIS